MSTDSADHGDRATLLWLPVGAGGHVVVHTSAWWERWRAAVERRPPAPLFHAALEFRLDGVPSVMEMAPAWGVGSGDQGVLATGPVGLAWLGRSRFFRYEIRCWAHGVIPDREWAVGDPIDLTGDAETIAGMLASVGSAPTLTWGQTVPDTGDMWNSNSLVSWVLATAGLPTRHEPPNGGRAPGWAAGEHVARRA
ncbi:hypothetical protein [Demequina muriae]|uniref:Uncharacterized protein n=1 Tax=Demequina muriae TaxID=3051664 RepID=A0ABT8GK31_9MICO|nr:hypothetical protein [Demequina sp. EGI L300058]MDN4481777.1 hypothetical protein [Demequina sp. EGI L300058]